MTKSMMDLREMIGFAAERLMELEIGAKTGADYGEQNSDRLAQRNGYRDRPHSSLDGLTQQEYHQRSR